MPRRRRMEMAGTVIHVLNRAARRERLFSHPADHRAFEQVLLEARERIPLRILAFCVMSTHWHFVVWPSEDGQVSRFMHWLTSTHAGRWNAAHGRTGTGPLYQGRFKSFPAESDGHVLRVCRYVERNALRANLVARAEDWPWGSLWHRSQGDRLQLLSDGPVALPRDWTSRVNAPETPDELAALRRCVVRGAPFGSPAWTQRVAGDWGLSSSLRPAGRPRTRVASRAQQPASESSGESEGGAK